MEEGIGVRARTIAQSLNREQNFKDSDSCCGFFCISQNLLLGKGPGFTRRLKTLSRRGISFLFWDILCKSILAVSGKEEVKKLIQILFKQF